MRRWIAMGVLIVALAALSLAACAFTGAGPETTADIDVIMDPANMRLEEATFTPGVSKDKVVEEALESVGNMLEGTDISTLETRATVGLYTGKDNQGNHVEERRVWVVVVDNLPMVFPSGPVGNSVDHSAQRQQIQLVVFFDADTGEEVEGSISGRWVDEDNR